MPDIERAIGRVENEKKCAIKAELSDIRYDIIQKQRLWNKKRQAKFRAAQPKIFRHYIAVLFDLRETKFQILAPPGNKLYNVFVKFTFFDGVRENNCSYLHNGCYSVSEVLEKDGDQQWRS